MPSDSTPAQPPASSHAQPQAKEQPFQQRRVGAYELTDRLGKGAFGKVYAATHVSTQQKVALKAIHRTTFTRSYKVQMSTRREIAVMRVVRHPCVVHLHDVFPSRNNVCMVMEYMEGGNLLHFIRKYRPLSPQQLFKIFYCVLSGLEFCHACSVCHRDIKPENILMDAKGDVAKLADFGLANFIKRGSTLLTTRCGSPHYAAPEVHAGDPYSGYKADIWSLGVLLYAINAGRLPFDESRPAALLAKICAAQFAVPQHFEPDLVDILQRMLVRDPRKRISIAEIKQRPYWRVNCGRYGLDPQGMHTKFSLPEIHRSPTARRQSSPVVNNDVELPGSVAKLRENMSGSVRSSTDIDKRLLRSAEPLGRTPSQNALRVSIDSIAPEDMDDEGCEPARFFEQQYNLLPHQVQLPVEGLLNEEIVEVLLKIDTVERCEMEALLRGSEPSLAKALYKLLVRNPADLELITSLYNVFCSAQSTSMSWMGTVIGDKKEGEDERSSPAVVQQHIVESRPSTTHPTPVRESGGVALPPRDPRPSTVLERRATQPLRRTGTNLQRIATNAEETLVLPMVDAEDEYDGRRSGDGRSPPPESAETPRSARGRRRSLVDRIFGKDRTNDPVEVVAPIDPKRMRQRISIVQNGPVFVRRLSQS